MIHAFLRFCLRPIFWVYYRKMLVTGLENIPAKGPLILACNHPNSFLDALIIGIYTTRRIYFLARSDVFNSPIKRWILGQASLLPIYRLQEGMENLEKNKTTFAECFKILDRDAMILIFSEGLCIQELRLRPLKKGTARIALEYAKEGKHLHIVPVGINYLKPRTTREEVMVNFGTPFDAADFTESYASNPGKAMNEFTKILENKLRLSVIDIKDKGSDVELTQVMQTVRNEGKNQLELVKLASDIDEMRASNESEYNRLLDNAREYSLLLQAAQIDDRAVTMQNRASWVNLLMPLYWLGRILNVLPFVTAKWLAKTKVRRAEFYDSVFLGALMFLTQFYILIVFLILLPISPLIALVAAATLPITGALSTILHDSLRKKWWIRRKRELPHNIVEELERLRREILEQVPR